MIGAPSIPSFAELFERLQQQDETVEIEAKTAQEVGKSILASVSAFANEPGNGGGYFLFGVQKRNGRYEIVGIPDPDKLQADLATLCRNEMNVPISPLIRIEQYEGKTVGVAYVPEAESYQKPVYVASRGLPRGAYRRIGSTDQRCNDEDMALFFAARSPRPYEELPLTEAAIEDLDSDAIAAYRRRRATRDLDATELTYTDHDLLLSIGAATIVHGTIYPTVAGMMLFGRREALRRLFPMHRIDYIRVPTREWVPNPEHRYEGREWREAFMTAVDKVITAVVEDIPSRFTLTEGGIYRQDVPIVPTIVVREAIVNALMHRDYSVHATVQIIRYANRIEIRNSGYSLVPDDQLGEPGSKPRNPRVANVFHDTGLAETKGTGIRAMREEMRKANLTEPLFTSDRAANQFLAVLLVQHLLDPVDHAWMGSLADCQLSEDQVHALAIVREAGFVTNTVYRSLSGLDTLAASKQLQRLRDLELLSQQGGGAATYYLPGPRLLAAFTPGATSGGATAPDTVTPLHSQESRGFNPLHSQQSRGFTPLDSATESASEGVALPSELRSMVRRIEGYARRSQVEEVIRALCAWRSLSHRQIASLLNRNPAYVQHRYLTPMVERGALEYTYPDIPAHPLQAYRTTKKGTDERRS